MEVAIYFDNGHVAYFKEVANFEQLDGEIKFDYFGVASQKHKTAYFFNHKIAGISITKEE